MTIENKPYIQLTDLSASTRDIKMSTFNFLLDSGMSLHPAAVILPVVWYDGHPFVNIHHLTDSVKLAKRDAVQKGLFGPYDIIHVRGLIEE